MNKCPICNHLLKKAFKQKVLNKYLVSYYFCPFCNFIKTEKPYWLKEAYQNPITNEDTGIIFRNIKFVQITSSIIYFCLNKKAIYLDYAGGYGIFSNMMRALNLIFFHYDPYCKNIFSSQYSISLIKKNYEAITAFEYFEHSEDPIKDFRLLTNKSKYLIFSTELHKYEYKNQVDKKWFYFYSDHGQHISFYSLKTLKQIARKLNLNLYSNNKNYHILTRKKMNQLVLKLIFIFYEFAYFYTRRKLK